MDFYLVSSKIKKSSVRFEVRPLKFGSTRVRHLKVRFGSSSKKVGSNTSLGGGICYCFCIQLLCAFGRRRREKLRSADLRRVYQVQTKPVLHMCFLGLHSNFPAKKLSHFVITANISVSKGLTYKLTVWKFRFGCTYGLR